MPNVSPGKNHICFGTNACACMHITYLFSIDDKMHAICKVKTKRRTGLLHLKSNNVGLKVYGLV